LASTISLTVLTFAETAGCLGEIDVRSWLAEDGTNLGGIIAATVAAVAGVAGAYWAARAATRAGVLWANELELARERRFRSAEAFTLAGIDVRRLAQQVRDISFDQLRRRGFDHPESGSFLPVEDVARVHAAFMEVEALLGPLQADDAAMETCWQIAHTAMETFGHALDKVREFDRLPKDSRPSVKRRAGAYLFPGVAGEEQEQLLMAIGDESKLLSYAPPLKDTDMVFYRTAESYINTPADLSADGFLAANSLFQISAALMYIGAKIASDGVDGGDVLDMDSVSTSGHDRPSASDLGRRLLSIRESQRKVQDAPPLR
jgi:hypothetical protein